ncbi:MAG: FAD-dependent monooxygenase, partial [Actinomycetota bacterium]
MTHDRILIVGAGLAGLALARALGHAGLTPELVEREAGWRDAGTGMYLPANGVRALQTLGLAGAVAARGTRIPRQRLLDHRGHLLAEIDLHQLWGGVGPCLALPRAELHQVLRQGVPVRLGRTVHALERLEGPVQVTFDDGRRSDYDLVVGADGLRSSVRRLAVDPRPPVPVGQHSWRFLAACPPEVTSWTVMLGRGASFLTVPVSHGLVYCYADVTAGTAGSSEGNGDPLSRLRERFAGFAAPVPGLVEQLEERARIH